MRYCVICNKSVDARVWLWHEACSGEENLSNFLLSGRGHGQSRPQNISKREATDSRFQACVQQMSGHVCECFSVSNGSCRSTRVNIDPHRSTSGWLLVNVGTTLVSWCFLWIQHPTAWPPRRLHLEIIPQTLSRQALRPGAHREDDAEQRCNWPIGPGGKILDHAILDHMMY